MIASSLDYTVRLADSFCDRRTSALSFSARTNCSLPGKTFNSLMLGCVLGSHEPGGRTGGPFGPVLMECVKRRGARPETRSFVHDHHLSALAST